MQAIDSGHCPQPKLGAVTIHLLFVLHFMSLTLYSGQFTAVLSDHGNLNVWIYILVLVDKNTASVHWHDLLWQFGST